LQPEKHDKVLSSEPSSNHTSTVKSALLQQNELI